VLIVISVLFLTSVPIVIRVLFFRFVLIDAA
jgi:hypothetical protein